MSGALTLKGFSDRDGLFAMLSGGGLGEHEACKKAQRFSEAAQALRSLGVKDGASVYGIFVPGRIEVLGKHTDYAGGQSLLTAIEKGFCVVFAERSDAVIRMVNAKKGRDAEFAMHADLVPTQGQWTNYPMTVARRVARNFPGKLRGANISYQSDLPQAAGMSTSSALIVACFLVLAKINDLYSRAQYRENIDSLESLGGYLGTVENGQSFGALVGDKGVGTFGGSQDHTAILCCKPGQVSNYSFCPVKFLRDVSSPKGYTYALGVSGVVAEKTGEALEKYNRASRLASAVAELWRAASERDDAHMAAAMRSGPGAAQRMRQILRASRHAVFSPRMLLDRFEQFYAESEQIIPAAGGALAKGEMTEFGRLVDQSQELSESKLKNQVKETVFLAKRARELGASAASGFGAGFGGSVWALLRREQAEDFLVRWGQSYRARYPEHESRARFFLTEAGPAAFEVGQGD